MKRKNFEIASGSMADIAFLLLIFFLVSTTIEKDKGYVRNMAAKPEKIPLVPEPVSPENLLYVHLNDKDQLMVRNQFQDHDQLKLEIRKFYISNSPIGSGSANHPKWVISEKYPGYLSLNEKAIINIHPQMKTSYKSYMEVQSCVQSCVQEVRNEIANHYFGVSYDYLMERKEIEVDRISIIRSIVPIRIVDKVMR